MRDIKRIYDFCDKLADIWATNCPDWRFCQLMMNVLGSDGKDPWWYEEPEALKLFENFFKDN